MEVRASLPRLLPATSKVLFRNCANADPPLPGYGTASPQRACPPKPGRRRDSLLIPQSQDPSDVLDPATSEIASGSKLGIDATRKIPGEGFTRPWPPLIKMDAAVKAKVQQVFGSH